MIFHKSLCHKPQFSLLLVIRYVIMHLYLYKTNRIIFLNIQVMMDRDQMMNLVAQSSDNHMRFIDAREDLLTTRANNWRDHLIQGTNE